MKKKNLIGFALMLAFASLLFLNFGEQVGGYMDFEEALETGTDAHVVGYWVADKGYGYDPQRNIFSFYMEDESGQERRVEYANPKPANFEDAEKLVLQGHMRDELFVADHILVKCPSKYNDQQGLELQEAATL